MARAYWHAKNWGGHRPGAGRPQHGARTRKVSLTVPEDLLTIVDQVAYRRQLTRSAVVAHYLRRGLSFQEANPAPGSNP